MSGKSWKPGFVATSAKPLKFQVRSTRYFACTAHFSHSIHAITSGVKKLSFAMPTRLVYRGFANMKLPEAFEVADKFGIRAGADYAFMSTTMEQDVALGYSLDPSGKDTASTLLSIQMDEANRGAAISFLSYYPVSHPYHPPTW